MEELLFKTIESGWQPLPRVKKLQDEIEVLKPEGEFENTLEDVEFIEV